MTSHQGIKFSLPADWKLSAADGTFSLRAPSASTPLQVQGRIKPLLPVQARRLDLLETVQANLPKRYPAYSVEAVIERPTHAGICVEAVLIPRVGSGLAHARFFAVLLSKHLVLIDYRRRAIAGEADLVIDQFAHGLREQRTRASTTAEFAAHRRVETKHVRRGLKQWQAFLSHNSEDKDEVRKIRDALFEKGVVCWFDETHLRASDRPIPKMEEGIEHADAVLVARGGHDFGPWQELEYEAAMNEYMRRNRANAQALKIIPVALKDAPAANEWRGFLNAFRVIDCREGPDSDGIQALVEAILPGQV